MKEVTPAPYDQGDEPEVTADMTVVWEGVQVPIDWDIDPVAIQRSIVERVFKAQTVDDVFAVYGGDATGAMANRVTTITAVGFGPYESERGVIPMAHVSGADPDTGEEMNWRTTATSIVAMLARFNDLRVFPLKVRVVGNKTRSGQTAYHLERG